MSVNVSTWIERVTRRATATCQGDQASVPQARNLLRIALSDLAAMDVCALGTMLRPYRKRRQLRVRRETPALRR